MRPFKTTYFLLFTFCLSKRVSGFWNVFRGCFQPGSSRTKAPSGWGGRSFPGPFSSLDFLFCFSLFRQYQCFLLQHVSSQQAACVSAAGRVRLRARRAADGGAQRARRGGAAQAVPARPARPAAHARPLQRLRRHVQSVHNDLSCSFSLSRLTANL